MYPKLKKVLAYSLFAASVSMLSAQDLSTKGVGELRDEVNSLVEEGSYVQARPLLTELVKRFDEVPDKSPLEDIYFFLGFGYIQEYMSMKSANHLESAIPYFDKVITDYPNGKRVARAIELKASCLNGLGKFEEAADTWAISLNPPYVNSMNIYERFAVVKKISQAYYNMKNWEKGKQWFERMYKEARSIEDKSFAAVALIRANLAEENFDEAKKYFPDLTHPTPARYDINLSADFMSFGDKLADRSKYAEASLCYTFVLSKEDIVEYYTNYKSKVEKTLQKLKTLNAANPRIQDLTIRLQTAESILSKVGGISEYKPQLLARKARNYFQTKRNYESFWAYRQLLDSYADDKMAEDFYVATFVCAKTIGKDKQVEAIADEYRQKFPDGKYLKDINLQYALYLLEKGKTNPEYTARFFDIAKGALAKNPDDDAAPEYIYLMGSTWLSDKEESRSNYKQMRSYFLDFAEKNPDSAAADGALYWAMLSFLSKQDYSKSFELANKIIEKYGESIYIEDTNFRRAVSKFGEGDVSGARGYFEKFIEEFGVAPTEATSKLLGEAELFLGDICFMEQEYKDSYEHYMKVPDITENPKTIEGAFFQCAGMLEAAENYTEQAKILNRYIEQYPNGNRAMAKYLIAKPLLKEGLSADAVNGYMDVLKEFGSDANNDSVDKIIAEYPEFYQRAKEQIEASEAFLKKAVNDKNFLLMLVRKPDERYDYFEANPKINKMLYLLFKVKMGEKEAVFGENILKDKAPLVKLYNIYKAQLNKFPKQTPEQFFKSLLEKAKADKDRILEARMQMALDSIGKLPERPRIFAQEDFKDMPCKVIVWMGKSNERYGAAGEDSAIEAYDFVINSDSEYRLDAAINKAMLFEKKKEYSEAKKLYAKAEDEFPMDDRAPKMALKQAELSQKMGNIAEAREKYNTILSTTSWTGEPHAEAFYMLGMLEKQQRQYKTAIMYFGRCAMGFAECLDFSGKSVLEGAKLSMAVGDPEQAREFCKEFLIDESNKECKEYEAIADYYNSIK